MEISQKLLAVMAAASAALGAALGLIWDVLRLLRAAALSGTEQPAAAPVPLPRRAAHAVRAALLFAADVLFGLVCGAAAVLLLYYTNEGQFRTSALACMAGGFAVWQYTVGRLNKRMTNACAAWLHRTVRAVRQKASRKSRARAGKHRRRSRKRTVQDTDGRQVPEQSKKFSKKHPKGAKKRKAVRCI